MFDSSIICFCYAEFVLFVLLFVFFYVHFSAIGFHPGLISLLLQGIQIHSDPLRIFVGFLVSVLFLSPFIGMLMMITITIIPIMEEIIILLVSIT